MPLPRLSRVLLAGSVAGSAALIGLVVTTCGQPTKQAATPPPPLPKAPAQPISSDLAAADKGGGCNPAGLKTQRAQQFSDVNPSWVPVTNGTQIDSDPILLHGVVMNSHGDTGGDFPENHTSSDVVTDVQLDPAETGFAATGNDSPGVIALEWESAALESFAWPAKGDRVAAMGRWIFDCGHPNAVAGHCSSHTADQCVTDSDCASAACPECDPGETCQDSHFHYNSEMHPPYALAVSREGRGGIVSDKAGATATLATRTDVFVSPNGGAAGDRCVVTHIEDEGEFLLQHECYPLSQPMGLTNLNKWDFEFDIPLPARPAGATMSWHVVDRPAPGGVPAQITFEPHPNDATPTLHASVKLTQPVQGKLPTGFAATVFAGWDAPPSAPLTHLKVTVEKVLIHNPLRPVKPIVREVKDWVLEASVNGEAQRLTGLDAVNAGDAIPQSLTYEQYLPPDGALRIFAEGTVHTCIDTLFGKSFASDIGEVGVGSLSDCLQSEDPDPGDVDVTYEGPDFGAGSGRMTYTTDSQHGQGGFCSTTTSTPCLSDPDCPTGESCQAADGAFSLQYTIERVP